MPRNLAHQVGATFLLTGPLFVQTARADASASSVPLVPSASQQHDLLGRERTQVHLYRIRPTAFVVRGLTAALGISIIESGVSALPLSRDFSRHSNVGTMPSKELVAEGQHSFDVTIATDVLGIFAISAAIGAIILTVKGYGPAARKVLRDEQAGLAGERVAFVWPRLSDIRGLQCRVGPRRRRHYHRTVPACRVRSVGFARV